jgi:NADPH-dependent 2,4-dienoyl-CoA reductase/sulfur reductase-like enzyme
MQPRLSPLKAAPEAYAAVRALNDYVESSGLEAGLLDLVKTQTPRVVIVGAGFGGLSAATALKRERCRSP